MSLCGTLNISPESFPRRARWADPLTSLYVFCSGNHRFPAKDRPLGYARLDVETTDGCAGVNQHGEDIGQAAVDLLRNLLHSGQRGIATRPLIALVDGEWIDGPTAPRVRT